ncbi:tRNA (guanosine(37)-N1)-methyltransferase TrmD, partial [bacterium]
MARTPKDTYAGGTLPLDMMRVGFVTLFPEVIRTMTGHSILARAALAGRVKFETANPRDYTYDRHGKVDERPYSGQPGMLLKAEPVYQATRRLLQEGAAVVVSTDPAGDRFDHRTAEFLASQPHVIFLCGHYEGIDERVIDEVATHRYSIGDYVMTSGELAALVMADATVRRLPGVLGDAASLDADSFADGLLGSPNYTRPPVWRGRAVPEVLLSGDHKKIEK